jgi:hypothetical protein
MTNPTDTVDSAVALKDDSQPEAPKADRVRGHDLDKKSLALIVGAIAAGTAVILGAMAGSATSISACEKAVRTQVSAALMGDQSAAGAPRACDGIAPAEVDKISGEVFGKAFAG